MTRRLLRLRPATRWWLLGGLTAAVLAGAAAMAPSGRVLQQRGAGIVDFELAGPGGARDIVAGWGEVGVAAAREQLLLDCGWLVLYGAALAVGCVAVGQAAGGRWATAGVWLSRGAVVAAGLDLVENLSLLAVLEGRYGAARAAQLAAWPKFVLALSALAFCVLLLVRLAARRAVGDRSIGATA